MADSSTEAQPLTVGFVPEHFSAPLWYAQQRFGLAATLRPFPTGTGAMIAALRAGEIDVGIGLTEAWVAGLGRAPGAAAPGGGYVIVGTYVASSLNWAVSTGAARTEVRGIEVLKGGKLGVSRVGSGSHIMACVLAEREGWLTPGRPPPFTITPLGDFASLRAGVADGRADAFMWEYFTSKRYIGPAVATADAPLKPLSTIPTPWPSWMIASAPGLVEGAHDSGKVDLRLEKLFEALDMGIKYFEEHPEESIEYISTQLDYSEKDAWDWRNTVLFARQTKGVGLNVLQNVLELLGKAGVVETDDLQKDAEGMAGLSR